MWIREPDDLVQLSWQNTLNSSRVRPCGWFSHSRSWSPVISDAILKVFGSEKRNGRLIVDGARTSARALAGV
jgi:hypothetical protein